MLLLIKITPKIDPIVKELTSLIEGEKLDKDQKVEASEALALILKSNGKSVQEAMIENIKNALISVLKGETLLINEKTLINCSFALSFLAFNLKT